MPTFGAYPNADGYWRSTGTFDTTGQAWVAGYTGSSTYGAFFRWASTGIQQGSTISAAAMDYTKTTGSGTPNVRIFFEAADNPTFPSDQSDAAGRAVTTAYASITSLPSNGRHSTPDLSAPIQEVVNRPGFAEDAIQSHWRDVVGSGSNYLQGYTIERTGTGDDPYLSITYTEPSDDLTANSIATAAPSVGAPALGQIHALTATGIATAAPSVGSPTLAEIVALTVDSVATDSPSVDSPALGQIHALTAANIATAAPSVGAPALSVIVALAADSIASGAPFVGSPALGQVHILTATGVTTAAPSVGSPSIAQTHALSATALATAAPSVGSPVLTQIHALIAEAIASGAPSVGSPILAILGAPAASRRPPLRMSVTSSAPQIANLTPTAPRITKTTRSAPQ